MTDKTVRETSKFEMDVTKAAEKICLNTSQYFPVVVRALGLIGDYVNGRIKPDEMADKYYEEVLFGVRKVDEKKGGVTVNENYPMRLVMFTSYNFIDWHKWRTLYKAHEMYPEKFAEPKNEEKFQEILEMNYDGKFMRACNEFLEELAE